jgi:hypothetical protein
MACLNPLPATGCTRASHQTQGVCDKNSQARTCCVCQRALHCMTDIWPARARGSRRTGDVLRGTARPRPGWSPGTWSTPTARKKRSQTSSRLSLFRDPAVTRWGVHFSALPLCSQDKVMSGRDISSTMAKPQYNYYSLEFDQARVVNGRKERIRHLILDASCVAHKHSMPFFPCTPQCAFDWRVFSPLCLVFVPVRDV